MGRSWLLGLCVASVFAASGCFEDPYDFATVYVRIQTLDAATGDPVPGIVVQSSDGTRPSFTTDEDGRVAFEDEVLTMNDDVFGGAYYYLSDPDGVFAESMVIAGEEQRDPEAAEIVVELQPAAAD